MEKLLTIPEVADLLNVHHNTVRRMIRDGQLVPVQMGYNLVRVAPEEVRRYVAQAIEQARRDPKLTQYHLLTKKSAT